MEDTGPGKLGMRPEPGAWLRRPRVIVWTLCGETSSEDPAKQFSWPDECRQAFEELKKYLTSPPLLVRPEVGEVLYLYLATSPEAVSSVLIRENENRVHQPVYYVSKVLHEAETRYSKYRSRPALKAKVLADFIAECPTTDLPSREGDPVKVGTSNCDLDPAWILHIDGASNAQGSGAGFLLTNSEGVVTEHALQFNFKASNNQAEYEALVVGLKLALKLGIDRLKVFSDSQLIVGQTKGEFKT
ncbi:uncharacterized protein [Elaeis guineensis]|uniref:uncharacterized protein n=1 Tax=Elaeis guineensis var. tenera TaxID=51953 RepID=UPI003C6DA7D7